MRSLNKQDVPIMLLCDPRGRGGIWVIMNVYCLRVKELKSLVTEDIHIRNYDKYEYESAYILFYI